MLYLLRFSETGREAQRGKTSRDIIDALRGLLGDIRVDTHVGRIVLDSDEDALDALMQVHGVASFSPCHHCSVDDLPDAIVGLVGDALDGARSFRVSVKRVGDHDFTSREMAATLGRRICQKFSELTVDLHEPDALIGVEIRDRDCYVYDQVIPGADRTRDETAVAAVSGQHVRFLVDQMLRPLAGWLRLLGFDSDYMRDVPDCLLVRRAREQGRIIVTRDRELSETPAVTTVFIETSSLPGQLDQVAEALDLHFDRSRMFTRCSLCNRPVETVDKAAARGRVPDEALDRYDEFTACRPCDKLYWKGEQYEKILDQLSRVL